MNPEGIIITPNFKEQKFEINPVQVTRKIINPPIDLTDDQKARIVGVTHSALLDAFGIEEQSYWVVSWTGVNGKIHHDQFADWNAIKEFQSQRISEGHHCWISPELKRWVHD